MTHQDDRIPKQVFEEQPPHEVQEDDDVDAFDEGCDAGSFDEDFDPMQALGQLLVTQEGETIPDVLVGIRHSIDTLTKVLHKMCKNQESQKA